MKELERLGIRPLMLKKFPQIVKTVIQVREGRDIHNVYWTNVSPNSSVFPGMMGNYAGYSRHDG